MDTRKPADVESFVHSPANDGPVSRSSGVSIAELDTLTSVFVRTKNSIYRIDVLDPERHVVTVQGGAFFAQPTRAWLRGSGSGGTCHRVGWIGVGFHLEFRVDGRSIRTSRVLSFEVGTRESSLH
jgi:hypothetical protein